MIVKLAYDGWQYFEGEEVKIKYGQSFLSNIDNDIIIMIPGFNCPPKGIEKDFGVTTIDVVSGSLSKRIFIPYYVDASKVENRVYGYILNNEGKTIDKI